MTAKQVIERYHQSWIQSDRDRARSLLSDDLKFRSPQDNFDSADDFLAVCWHFADGFDKLNVLHAVYASDAGYIVYSGGDFCCGELLKLRDGRISEIYVTFDPTH